MNNKQIALNEEQHRIVNEYCLTTHAVMVQFASKWAQEQPEHKLFLAELDWEIERSVLDALAERLEWDAVFADLSDSERLLIVDQVADSINWPVAQRIIDAEVEERLAKADNA